MSERINMTIPDDMRDRFEAWRAKQYEETGRIPSLADAARILIHRGLAGDGFPVVSAGGDDAALTQEGEE